MPVSPRKHYRTSPGYGSKVVVRVANETSQRAGLLTAIALAALAGGAILLAVAQPATAVWALEQPLPYGLRVGSGTNGEIAYSLFENDANILYGGFTTGDTTSQWSFNVDGQIFTSAGGSGPGSVVDPSLEIDDYNATHTWTILGAEFTLNTTLVYNSTLLVMTLRSSDGNAHDVGFRYMWDTYLEGAVSGTPDGPEIMIASEPGDTPGSPGCYSQREEDFALPEFPLVKMWQQCTGPDDELATKAYLVWDEAMGGTTPDRFTIASWGASFSTGNSWHFQVDPSRPNLQNDNSVITWWGYYDPIRVEPGNETSIAFWYGRDIPPALTTYFVNVFFNDRANAEPPEGLPSLADVTRLRFVEPGSTTFYPIRVVNNGGTRGADPETTPPTLFDVALEGDIPPGWGYSLVEGTSQAPVESIALRPEEARDVRLKVVAPLECGSDGADAIDCALGNDAARVNVTVGYHDKPNGYYNKLKSRLEQQLYTTTIIKPHYGVELTTDGELVEIAPGATAVYHLNVTNKANLREPLPVEMGLNTILNPGWQAVYTPARLALAHGETQPVRLAVTVPGIEPGGDHVLTTRAGVSGKTDFDTAEVSLRVIAERAIRIETPANQQTIPPGGTVLFPITVSNEGAQAVPVQLNLTLEQASKAAGWTVSMTHPGFPSVLSPGRSASATVAMTAPPGIQAGERSSALFSVRLAGKSDVLNSLGLAGIAGAVPNADLDGRDGANVVAPGSTVPLQVAAKNTGNRVESLRLLPASLPAGWTADVTPTSMTLAPGQEGVYDVQLHVASGAPSGASAVGFRLVDRDSVTQQALARTLTVATVRVADSDVEPRLVRVLPEDPFEVVLTLTNLGNTAEDFVVDGLPEGWLTGSSEPWPWHVEIGETRDVRLQLHAPDDIDTYDLGLALRSGEGGNTFPADADGTLKVFVSRPDLSMQSLTLQGTKETTAQVAQLVTISARVLNAGDVGARDFNVRLLVDGEPTDSEFSVVFLEAADTSGNPSSALVTLAWVPNVAGEHELQVVADTEQAIREARRDNNAATLRVEVLSADDPVQPLDRVDHFLQPAPGLGPLAGIAALGLAAAWRRRSR